MSGRSMRHSRAKRRGKLVAEALVVIPILLIVTVAFLEFSLVLTLRRSVAGAAILASREAGKGATADEVANLVETSLAGYNISIGPDIGILLEDPQLMIEEPRGLACTAPGSNVSNGNVRVTVCVPSTGTPIVGSLQKLGAPDLIGKILSASAVAKKECP